MSKTPATGRALHVTAPAITLERQRRPKVPQRFKTSIDLMSKPARRLDAREDDLEALREHAAQQGAAIRPPERQERRDAGLGDRLSKGP